MIKSLSVILPLYNEEMRIKKILNKKILFIKKNKINFKDFVFVDDGSNDNSFKLINEFINKNRSLTKTSFKVIKLRKNIGKGGALKKGVRICSCDWILTSDIDFSVSLFELDNWLKKKYIENSIKVYFGSRSHNKSLVKSKFYRKFVGILMRVLISFILGIKISDTQCGYKLYKKNIAKNLFSKLKFLGYEHDIEIVLLLKKQNIKIKELPVSWKHVDHSKVNIIQDSIKTFIKLFYIKLKY